MRLIYLATGGRITRNAESIYKRENIPGEKHEVFGLNIGK